MTVPVRGDDTGSVFPPGVRRWFAAALAAGAVLPFSLLSVPTVTVIVGDVERVLARAVDGAEQPSALGQSWEVAHGRGCWAARPPPTCFRWGRR
jgi:hypothetical protein